MMKMSQHTSTCTIKTLSESRQQDQATCNATVMTKLTKLVETKLETLYQIIPLKQSKYSELNSISSF